jgi:hypothetical protein
VIHISGTFSYQRPGLVSIPAHGGITGGITPPIVERQPSAFYLGVILRQDDGEPVFGGEVDDPSGQDVFPFGASVLMSRPQILLGGSADLGLSLSLDTVLGDYLGLVGTLDPTDASRLPNDWVPLAIGIWGPREGWGILTAAPEPIPVTGIAPPVRLNTEPEGSVELVDRELA